MRGKRESGYRSRDCYGLVCDVKKWKLRDVSYGKKKWSHKSLRQKRHFETVSGFNFFTEGVDT